MISIFERLDVETSEQDRQRLYEFLSTKVSHNNEPASKTLPVPEAV
jgi:hypothetical protein